MCVWLTDLWLVSSKQNSAGGLRQLVSNMPGQVHQPGVIVMQRTFTTTNTTTTPTTTTTAAAATTTVTIITMALVQTDLLCLTVMHHKSTSEVSKKKLCLIFYILRFLHFLLNQIFSSVLCKSDFYLRFL